MERTISQEERIRRAQEIYQRRNNSREYKTRIEKMEVPTYKKAKGKMKKKLVLQSAICLIIYFAIYFAKGTNIASINSLINSSMENIKRDANVEFIKMKAEEFKNWAINKYNSTIEKEQEEINVVENTTVNEEVIETTSKEVEETESAANEVVEKSQEELDIEYLKNKNIIWPLNGIITSGFGARQSTEIVSANHYGIDISGNEGTPIIAAIEGTVTLASTEGSYGKHIKIENENVTTLYAHCSELLVSEGQHISKGEEIAKVGQTGNATRTTPTFRDKNRRQIHRPK